METNWLNIKLSKRKIKCLIFILIPIVLYFIPLDWLTKQHTVCLYKNITGHDCYGCGLTRAVLSALHFEFVKAFHYNKLFIIVMPLLIYIWIKMLIKQWSSC